MLLMVAVVMVIPTCAAFQTFRRQWSRRLLRVAAPRLRCVFVDDLHELVYAFLLLPTPLLLLLLPPQPLLLLLLSSLPASSWSLLRQDGPARTAFTLTIPPWSSLSPFALSLPFPPSLTEYWTRCPNIVCRIALCRARACALRDCDALRRQTRRKTA
jgi:hypothetical protein